MNRWDEPPPKIVMFNYLYPISTLGENDKGRVLESFNKLTQTWNSDVGVALIENVSMYFLLFLEQ